MITISGYGRGTYCSKILHPHRDIDGDLAWNTRTMLFMHALELDLESCEEDLPDLQGGNIERELRKAYTAFSSRADPQYSNIYTGYWGCGTFGSNRGVKAIVQWCAASLVRSPLTFICSNVQHRDFGVALERFVAEMTAQGASAELLLEVSRNLQPASVNDATQVFDAVSEGVKARVGLQIFT